MRHAARPLGALVVLGAATLAVRRLLRAKAAKGKKRGAPKAVVLGLGYCGGAIARKLSLESGCEVCGTTRGEAEPADAQAGVRTLILGAAVGAAAELAAAVEAAEVVVATAPPGEGGDPFLTQEPLRSALESAASRGALIIYLSSVGVYGDQDGRPVTEETPPAPRTARAKRRLVAEETWRSFAAGHKAARLAIVRLPGIYGPYRGPVAKAREGNTRIIREGHLFSRIHVEDVVKLCGALLGEHRARDPHGLWAAGEACVINCCDSDPAPQHEVSARAYELLGVPVPAAVPFDSAELSAMQRSFYEESRRMTNDKYKGIVGSLVHDSYRTGLPACLEAEAKTQRSIGFGLGLPLAGLALGRLAKAAAGAAQRLLRGDSGTLRVALVDNGSLKPEATLSLRRLAAALQATAKERGLPLKVEAVSARFADRIPARDLDGVGAEVMAGWLKRVAQKAGWQRPKVLLLPLLIGPSNTLTKSMPEASLAAPGLDVEIAPSLVCLCPALFSPEATGARQVAAMLVDRLADVKLPAADAPAAAEAEAAAPALDTVLLCDHGSPSAPVAAAREAVRAELATLLGRPVVAVCMERRPGPEYDFNGDLLEDALKALPQGARVKVALLFLQEGRHAGPGGDIVQILQGVSEARPDLTLATTRVLAGHPGLVDLLYQRIGRAVPARIFH